MPELLRNIDANTRSVYQIFPKLPQHAYLVCSMTTLKGILGIQEIKQTTVKIEKRRKTIPPDQYLLDSM